MIFRQLYEPETSTYTYLLGCQRSRRACLIDTVATQAAEYIALLSSLDLRLIYTLETHVHADHITAAGLLREQLGSKSVVHRDAGASCADLMVTDGVLLQIGDLEIVVRHMPGHTAGCVSYVLPDRVFSGDALLIDGCGRTDFQQGDAGQLYDSITQNLFTLPPDTLVYPGHDYQGNTVSTIKQEMAKNSRLGFKRSREDFIALMRDLKLAYPQQIHTAIPANQSCGSVTIAGGDCS
ncbi:MBL fold metallo-hydrolase [Methylomonas paludis]|uniref:MBL fold metallo-hydrolase n=1 Tax=Methylomonas paludis TaxID=1173101 RepID=A0A975MKE5_9GAMM|nr:MBL fold metallo-hydrolase [Methylomonas paludis]QWF69523.1 MBL fold metallo-hydrolase [Methylomonas paludis]